MMFVYFMFISYMNIIRDNWEFIKMFHLFPKGGSVAIFHIEYNTLTIAVGNQLPLSRIHIFPCVSISLLNHYLISLFRS